MLTNCNDHAAAGIGARPREANSNNTNACASSARTTAAARTLTGRSGRRIPHQTRRSTQGSSSAEIGHGQQWQSQSDHDAHCRAKHAQCADQKSLHGYIPAVDGFIL
jgi:hypothetical protein